MDLLGLVDTIGPLSVPLFYMEAFYILFNMQWLKQLGQMIAAFLGPIRLINIYVITGIGGFLLSMYGVTLQQLVLLVPYLGLWVY